MGWVDNVMRRSVLMRRITVAFVGEGGRGQKEKCRKQRGRSKHNDNHLLKICQFLYSLLYTQIENLYSHSILVDNPRVRQLLIEHFPQTNPEPFAGLRKP